MQIAHFHAQFAVVIGELLGHALGERGDEHALAFFFADVDFAEQIVHLGADGADFDKRVDQAGGAHHLLHHLAGVLFFVFGGGGRHKHRLRHDAFEFGEFERAVVAGAGQAEAVVHQVLLAAGIAFIHAADLGHGNVALVDKHNRIFGQIVHQRGWRLALFFAGKMAAVVFNAFAKAHFIEHFQIETGALLDALGFDGAVFLGVEGHAFAQFFFDALASTQHGVARGNVVAGGEHGVAAHSLQAAAGERVEQLEAVDFVVKQADAQRHIGALGGVNINHIATHAERAAFEIHVAPVVLHRNQNGNHVALAD